MDRGDARHRQLLLDARAAAHRVTGAVAERGLPRTVHRHVHVAQLVARPAPAPLEDGAPQRGEVEIAPRHIIRLAWDAVGARHRHRLRGDRLPRNPPPRRRLHPYRGPL